MKRSRWLELMKDQSLEVTRKEFDQGWHFCWDWDGLLVGPGMGEWDFCTCHPLKKDGEEGEQLGDDCG